MGNAKEQKTAGIWEQVHERLRAFIAKRVENEAEAEDVLQDVFVRVHRSLPQLKDPDRVVPWVYQITRHAIIDYYRSSGHRALPIGLAEELEVEQAALPSESQPTARTELSGCLRPMIAKLPDEYRQAIMLVELDGLTQKEAAQRLGLSIPGMKSRVQRGRRQLKMLLEECCEIELDGRKGVMDFERRSPDAPAC